MENPFDYLQFATGDQFYDRREIRKDLLSRFLSGQSNVTLSVSQKKLLIALARERTDEFGDAYRRRYALGVSSTVNSAKAKLMEDGLIERSDGRYVVADPFFAQFLRMA